MFLQVLLQTGKKWKHCQNTSNVQRHPTNVWQSKHRPLKTSRNQRHLWWLASAHRLHPQHPMNVVPVRDGTHGTNALVLQSDGLAIGTFDHVPVAKGGNLNFIAHVQGILFARGHAQPQQGHETVFHQFVRTGFCARGDKGIGIALPNDGQGTIVAAGILGQIVYIGGGIAWKRKRKNTEQQQQQQQH